MVSISTLNTHSIFAISSLVNRLYGSNASVVSSVDELSRLSLVQFVVWSSGAIDRRLNTLLIIIFCCCCSLSSIVRLSSGADSIDRIN